MDPSPKENIAELEAIAVAQLSNKDLVKVVMQPERYTKNALQSAWNQIEFRGLSREDVERYKVKISQEKPIPEGGRFELTPFEFWAPWLFPPAALVHQFQWRWINPDEGSLFRALNTRWSVVLGLAIWGTLLYAIF